MADPDSLAQSLSEEESELILGGGAVPASGTVKLKKGKASLSPTRIQKDQPGYKFKADQQTLTSPNFDFASQSKNGQTNNHSNSNSSSDDGGDQEEFVVLTPADVNGENGGSAPGTPTTPSKLPTPHKRTAELAETGSEKGTSGGANGSPPSSPAPKKHKAWDEYVAEDEAKKRAKTAPEGGDAEGEPRLIKKIGRCLGVTLLFMLPIIVGVYFGPRMNFGEQPQVGVTLTQKPVYSWGKANSAFFKNLKKMEAAFPKQNRETWIQLIASITSTLEETEPDHPAAITVLLPPSLPPHFSTCFLTKIAKTLNTAVSPILKNSSSKSSPSPPKVLTPSTFASSSITQIRADLDSYFKSEGKAVLALDVDKLQKEPELLLFHGLCDNFLAVDKRATVLFPVRVPLPIYQKYEWTHARGGDISTDVLNEAFGKVVSADTGPALVARIADAVILLNEGDTC